MDNPKKCIENARNRVLLNKLKGVVCDLILKSVYLVVYLVGLLNLLFPRFPLNGNFGNQNSAIK